MNASTTRYKEAVVLLVEEVMEPDRLSVLVPKVTQVVYLLTVALDFILVNII